MLASEIALKAMPYNNIAIIAFYSTEDRCFFIDMIQRRIKLPKYQSMFDLIPSPLGTSSQDNTLKLSTLQSAEAPGLQVNTGR